MPQTAASRVASATRRAMSSQLVALAHGKDRHTGALELQGDRRRGTGTLRAVQFFVNKGHSSSGPRGGELFNSRQVRPQRRSGAQPPERPANWAPR